MDPIIWKGSDKRFPFVGSVGFLLGFVINHLLDAPRDFSAPYVSGFDRKGPYNARFGILGIPKAPK